MKSNFTVKFQNFEFEIGSKSSCVKLYEAS